VTLFPPLPFRFLRIASTLRWLASCGGLTLRGQKSRRIAAEKLSLFSVLSCRSARGATFSLFAFLVTLIAGGDSLTDSKRVAFLTASSGRMEQLCFNQ
jgi:hypothetical protein